jgi:hypothetical protein
MFDPLKFAVLIIEVLVAKLVDEEHKVVEAERKVAGMTAQNAFAREEMVRIGKAERTFGEHRRLLDSDIAKYLARIEHLETRLNEL